MSNISRHVFGVSSLVIASTLCLLSGSAMAWDLSWPFGAGVSGSGHVSRTQRQVSAFKGVSLELPASVEIVQGEAEGLVIEADDNIAPLIETVVENEQLKIRWAQRFKSLKPTVLKLTVNVRALEQISISGSGDVNAAKLQSPTLEVRIAGSGDVRLAALQADSLTVSISGAGDFLAAGRADTARYSIAGSGDLKTSALASKNVRISIAGSGDAVVWASQTLNVSIAGSGDVAYYGDATVTRSVAGSGRIRRLGLAPLPGG
ncbi:MAG: head GIN domain-containing protein [Comamonadaceae bacterium]